ncbi:MAG: hypothetical protein [Bacteriophage sp.]|nr:MAG: hypothetical protein [Bacteriophage sp.]
MSTKNTSKTTAKTTSAKFAWNDENKAVVAEDYKAALATSQDTANSTEFLGTLAAKVGALSAASVRSQLVSAGIYQKGEIKKVGGKTAPRKAHFIRAIELASKANGVEVEKGTFDSLEHSKADTLKVLVALIPNAAESLESMLKSADAE